MLFRPLTRYKKLIALLGGAVLVLIVCRAYLPLYAKHKINTTLAEMDGLFCGRIEDVDIHIFRGAYSVQNVAIFARKAAGKICDRKIVTIADIDLSLSWSQLFKGRARLDIELLRPSLSLDSLTEALRNNHPIKPEAKVAESAQNVWATLIPWRIDSINVNEGELYYNLIGKDQTKPVLSNLEARAIGIEAGKQTSDPVLFTVKGNALNTALFLATGSFDLSRLTPRWDVDVSAEKVNLALANPLLLQRVPLTFTTGLLDSYAELQGQGSNFKGYVKLLFTDMDIVANGEDWKGFKHGAMEVLSSIIFTFLKSPRVKSTGTILIFKKDSSGFTMETGAAAWRAIEHRLGDPVKKGIENRYNLDTK